MQHNDVTKSWTFVAHEQPTEEEVELHMKRKRVKPRNSDFTFEEFRFTIPKTAKEKPKRKCSPETPEEQSRTKRQKPNTEEIILHHQMTPSAEEKPVQSSPSLQNKSLLEIILQLISVPPQQSDMKETPTSFAFAQTIDSSKTANSTLLRTNSALSLDFWSEFQDV